MKQYPIYSASISNQTTKEYYDFLVGEVNRKTTSLKVCKVLRKNGSHEYYTYHVISRK